MTWSNLLTYWKLVSWWIRDQNAKLQTGSRRLLNCAVMGGNRLSSRRQYSTQWSHSTSGKGCFTGVDRTRKIHRKPGFEVKKQRFINCPASSFTKRLLTVAKEVAAVCYFLVQGLISKIYVLNLINGNPDIVLIQNAGGATPLHVAAELGFEEIVAEILKVVKHSRTENELHRYGANKSTMATEILEAVNMDEETALFVATQAGQIDVVHMLLNAKANALVRNKALSIGLSQKPQSTSSKDFSMHKQQVLYLGVKHRIYCGELRSMGSRKSSSYRSGDIWT